MAGYRLPIEIEPLEEGGYLARSAVLPGFLVQADTIEDLVELAPGVARSLLQAMKAKGVPLPKELRALRPPLRVEILVPAP
ncbi:MAG: hypothetical protein A2Z21_03795 [Candidatus Fraserbacteria bacterium RBG_16_55_9]|uniref:Type II toxin-antitoxin system HicB family antitoxin n=1 Tax=Fraserbacteria sp. (strain RBG_16_55_9) TaxID=1817864 RepID=A0A1F5UPM4_FRAXR|nr:MAG: hypothetical protein A2Z21_03795 [Candidatus Fraserbacteria bacterium RBG_16_55_9]